MNTPKSKMAKVKTKKGSKKLSKEEDKLLIGLVKKHSILWDISHAQYKNIKKKRLIWLQMAQTMKQDGK